MIYRIVTEDNGKRDLVASLALKYFDGFSISYQEGYYKGVKEDSLVLEIDTLENRLNFETEDSVQALADDIKIGLLQECVLVQRISSYSRLV